MAERLFDSSRDASSIGYLQNRCEIDGSDHVVGWTAVWDGIQRVQRVLVRDKRQCLIRLKISNRVGIVRSFGMQTPAAVGNTITQRCMSREADRRCATQRRHRSEELDDLNRSFHTCRQHSMAGWRSNTYRDDLFLAHVDVVFRSTSFRGVLRNTYCNVPGRNLRGVVWGYAVRGVAICARRLRNGMGIGSMDERIELRKLADGTNHEYPMIVISILASA
jgi:hypothetical protein